jgi:hypothetical protein
VGCLGYADDVVLVAPSITALQNVCSEYGIEYGVLYNAEKTVCMEISKNKVNDHCDVYLGDSELKWVDSVKYLGVQTINDLCDSQDIMSKRVNFFGSVNSLLGNFKDLPSYIVNDLFTSYCCSFYGSHCWSFYNRTIKYVYSL